MNEHGHLSLVFAIARFFSIIYAPTLEFLFFFHEYVCVLCVGGWIALVAYLRDALIQIALWSANRKAFQTVAARKDQVIHVNKNIFRKS